MTLQGTQTSTQEQTTGSASSPNPLDLLRNIVKAYPKSTRDMHILRFVRGAWDNDDRETFFEVFAQFWATMNYRNVLPIVPGALTSKAQKLAVQQLAVTASVKSLVKAANRKIKLMFLERVMPNGKKARECSGPELRKFGGQWIKIAKGIPRGKKMGQTYKTEADVAKVLFGKSKKKS